MLPTQVFRYFRILILLVGLTDTSLIIEYWVRIQQLDMLDLLLWDVKACHGVTWLLTLVFAYVTFGSRPHWLLSNLRGALMIALAFVLLVVKSHFVHRYLGELAGYKQICADGVDRVMCRALPHFAWLHGFEEVPCGYVFAVLIIVEAIVTLRMDKRPQNTAKLATVKDAEMNLSTV
ncbi:hypothetical protein BGZ95_008406 [Linnemannia exigua]|uniref:Uncharacterized protein n=1 Tax=Linnemannia exigua TaxID=604196 RepID=A0AAD4DL48_9FUNG|nr:hypothetical protein BGZ95_008406 [Linnemannia exigua]